MRPMDLQALLPRSTDVARTKHVESKRPEVFQQHFAAETNRQYARRQHSVGRLTEAGNKRIEHEKHNPRDPHEERPGEGPGGGADTEQGAPEEDRAPKAGTGRPDGTGRLVNVVIGDGWDRE